MKKDPNDILRRVVENKPYHYNLKLYTKKDIERCIQHFIEEEEYEKCQLLSNWLKVRFNHKLNWKNINIHTDQYQML
jgi:hypothetical protein